jgi:hypothetical protein
MARTVVVNGISEGEHRNVQMKLKQTQDELRSVDTEHAQVIDNVIDAFGIRDAYPDVIKENIDRVHTSYGYMVADYPYSYTEYGRTKFVADITAAAAATKGSDALERIRAALGKEAN